MDDFGVLTGRFGLKPQGKSAPMAASKGSNHAQPRNFAAPNPKPSSYTSNSTYASNSHSFNDHNSSYDFDIFGGFQSNSKQTRSSNASGFDFDFDSVFSNTKNSSVKSTFDDDIFGGFNGSASPTINNDDIFGSFHSSSSSSTSKTQKSVAVDDLLGNFGGTKLKSPTQNGSAGFDDLIPGFGSSSSSAKGENARRATSSCILAEDPFVVLEQTSTMTKLFTDPLEEISKVNHSGKMEAAGSSIGSSPLKPPPKPGQVLKAGKVKKLDVSPIDELEDFAMGRSRSNANKSSDGCHASKAKESPSEKDIKYKEAEDAAWKPQQNADDLELFFSMGSRSSSVPKSRPAVLDPLHDARINGRGKPEFPLKKTSVTSPGMRKTSSTTNVMGDLSSIFGDATLFEKFEEVKGESDERRRARWDRHQRTRNRMEKAVADMNQRDRETLHEQEERLRISDRMDVQIKRWAAGKEGNMRALLSSLQYVLWPECDWEPVSLTDLITSSSVKKVYRQATLFVHPDKVQQKGATIEQKYTAEKVFDILKEAWNKFSKEELS